MLCQSCDCVYINGHKCHELGCSDKWKDYKYECKECGQKFIPENENQECCSQSCYEVYNGLDITEND